MSSEPHEPAATLGLRLGRYLGGYWNGAYLAHDFHDRPVVLKELPDEATFTEERVLRAVALEDSLRRDGYPAPEYLRVAVVHGRTYTIQEYIAGDVPPVLEPAHAQRLAELIGLHSDRAPADPTWAEHLLSPLRRADTHEQRLLRHADNSEFRKLLGEINAVGSGTDSAVLHSEDIVHYDLHNRNLLVRNGAIAAVIDWECARAGDARLDLLALAWSDPPGSGSVHPDAAAFLAEHISAVVPQNVRAALAAHLAFSKLTYAMQWGPPGTMERALAVTNHWLRPQWT